MNRKLLFNLLLIVAVVSIVVGLLLYFLLSKSKKEEEQYSGAVITSAEECTKLGIEILKKGGSAVDSAISACLCTGLTSPQQSGLGGGMIATIFIKETGVIETINTREVAPLDAFKDMFDTVEQSEEGGLAIAVPGELKGLYDLHKKYGKLDWKELVEPVALIAENGFKVSRYLRTVFETRGTKLRENKILR